MQWRVYLDDVLYDQPESLNNLTLGIKRDDISHGVFYEATVTSMRFSGKARDYVLYKKETEGIKAIVVIKIDADCDEKGVYENFITGRLNMSKVDETCGVECFIEVPIEQQDCTMLFRNRLDQKVDLDSLQAFDKVTALENYTQAGFTANIPSKALQVGSEGFATPETGETMRLSDLFGGGNFVVTIIRPSYDKVLNESISQTQLIPEVQYLNVDIVNGNLVSPVTMLDEVIDCFEGDFRYNFRFKGSFTLTNPLVLRFIVAMGTPAEGNTLPLPMGEDEKEGMIILDQFDYPLTGDSVQSNTFDKAFSGSVTLNEGQGIYGYLVIEQQSRADNGDDFIKFDPDTYVNIDAIRKCPDSDAALYMVNEALSRIAEAITNGCLKVKSDYYGRTDSQPYASTKDGCGSLRAINSGLQLRKGANAKLFLSWKDAWDGLNPIDNIGYGMEDDPARPGFSVVRVEPVEAFYTEEEILKLANMPVVKVTPIENGYYSTIKSGYEKWEVEKVNGLDEINANREYRTNLTTINNTLTILSKFVAGSYAIEQTRQQSYAATGAADTKYDNETFIYCMKRTESIYDKFEIEQGGITNPSNIFDPATVYNWRIRPYYNLMRWFKSIANGYPSVGDTEKKLFFTQGSANFLASGEQTDIICKLEAGVKAENSDVGTNDFIAGDYKPVFRPELIQVNAPMSMAVYKRIRKSPYGYISVQCGTSDKWYKGYIQLITYQPDQGLATFNLKRKWA